MNLSDAVRRQDHLPRSGDWVGTTVLNGKTAVLFVRPRGWHLSGEASCLSMVSRCPALLFDFGLFFFHNAKELLAVWYRALLLPAEN